MTAAFWIGFACGIAFVVCALAVGVGVDKISRLNGKFFLEMSAKRRRRLIKRMNK